MQHMMETFTTYKALTLRLAALYIVLEIPCVQAYPQPASLLSLQRST